MIINHNVIGNWLVSIFSGFSLPLINAEDRRRFDLYFNNQTVSFLRVTMFVTCILHIMLIWSDSILFPTDFLVLLAYHLYTVFGGLFLILISYHRKFTNYASIITSIVWVLSTISVSITVAIVQSGVYFYIVAVVFTFFYTCFFIRMTFKVATSCCFVGLAILNSALFLTNHEHEAYIFANATMGYATVIGIASCYIMEKLEREKFNLQLRLEREKEQSDNYSIWLGQLAAFLRHEVRQPIAQINSSVELCAIKSDGDPSLRNHLEDATNAAQHVWHLIERASRATDAEAFVRGSRPERVELREILGSLVQSFTQTHSGVRFELDASRACEVPADPVLLKEAVSNLLSNAASFAEEDSVVKVTLEVRDEKAQIKVCNDGPLIEGEAETLFQPFTSSRSGSSTEHHGLGLYLVRLIAQQHGGTAKIANRANGDGVEAYLALPLTR